MSGPSRAADERGAGLVEFALIAPVLILLMVGILDLARAVNAYVIVRSASQEGAHYAMLRPTAPPSAIASAVRARTSPLDGSLVTVTASYYDGSTFQSWPAGGVPASSPQPSDVPVRVAVSYPWSAATFVIGLFIGGGTGTTTFTSSSTVETRR